MASHCPERSRDFPTHTRVAFLCARERSRSSLRFFSSVSRAVSRLNRLLVVSSAAQCVNYRAESLAMRTESRERGPALLTCTDEEGGTSCRRKNLGDDLFLREKPSRSLSSFFCSRARPSGDSVWAYMVVKFPISTVQPNNTVAGEVWQRNNFLSLVVRWKVTCALACPRAPRDGTAIAGTIPYMSERPTSGFVGRS